MRPDDFSSAPSGPPVLAVSALNQAVARVLERSFPLVWVAGEISNFTRAASGHWYFTLKDDAAQVRAVMFKGRAQYADFAPREGDKVEVRTLVTLYAPRGDYQLNVEAIRRAGVGNLYEAFLRLKEKLEREGLFAPARKRPIPGFVRCIGIVTSPQAAALHDILTALRRRAPHVRVVLYPTPVQGEGAAARIARAIETASQRAECDVLLVGRGGGSMEDLWSFNDETVARAIAACAMPVIAGIGHETDFTIADFAADLRAPTPTAAAELCAIPRNDWLAALKDHASELSRAFKRQLAEQGQTLDWMSRRLVSPSTHIKHQRVRLQALQTRLEHATRMPAAKARYQLQHLQTRLQNRLPDVRASRQQLAEHSRRLSNAATQLNQHYRQQLATQLTQLELLNPQRTLERGYAIVTDRHGTVLRTPAQLQARGDITLRLAGGSADISIASVQPTLE
jgi:exodeoxyribonuclease VII large subunit